MIAYFRDRMIGLEIYCMTEKSRMYSYFHALFTLANFVVLRAFTSKWGSVKNAITEYFVPVLFCFLSASGFSTYILPFVNFFH